MSENENRQLFATPFSREYWRLAAKELKSLRMLLIAALLTALRIAVKSAAIPIGPQLNITWGFLINAIGSMIYGPVMAIFTSAVSDTLGAILFPKGAYFFPYIFEEIAGGVLFALFYYRAKLTMLRITAGRFAVTVICNLILSPLIQIWYNMVFIESQYAALTIPRVIKNLALFPLQSVALVILFNALLPITNRMGLSYAGSTKLKIEKKDIAALVVLTLIAALAAVLFYVYWYRTH